MTQSISEDIQAQLRQGPQQQIAAKLGIGEQQLAAAIKVALPLLLTALARNTASPEGAQKLFGALERDHGQQADASVAQNAAPGLDFGALAGALLGGVAGGSNRSFNAEGILSHILGSRKTRAEEGLSQAVGLGGTDIRKLLSLLAPIVMAYLGQLVASGKAASPDELGAMLKDEQARQEGSAGAGLFGALLDSDGDGRVDIGDLARLGSRLLGGRH